MRIGLLSLLQSTNDHPLRFISKRDAKNGVLRGSLKKISKKLYQEILLEAFPSSNPERHLTPNLAVIASVTFVNQKRGKTVTVPDTPSDTLNLYYPVADQSSYAKRDFKEVWGCDLDKWQRRMGVS